MKQRLEARIGTVGVEDGIVLSACERWIALPVGNIERRLFSWIVCPWLLRLGRHLGQIQQCR
jgi:hypothetical protein